MTAIIGHNSKPAYDPKITDDLEAKSREFADAAGQWKESGPIADDETASQLRDFIAGSKGLLKEIDRARREAKKPWDDAAKEVQEAFRPIADMVSRSLRLIEPIMGEYLRRKEREAAEEKRRIEAERRAAEKREKELREQAKRRHDVAADVAADVARKEAQNLRRAAKEAGKVTVKSASGGARAATLRTQRSARITNINQVFVHYRDHPMVAELLTKLATADVRARDVDETKIPGIEIIERKIAV